MVRGFSVVNYLVAYYGKYLLGFVKLTNLKVFYLGSSNLRRSKFGNILKSRKASTNGTVTLGKTVFRECSTTKMIPTVCDEVVILLPLKWWLQLLLSTQRP